MKMRADLHVHSAFSGARHYRRAGLSDAYARPGEIYDRARSAGMDLVTLTDRETIEGCLRLIDERGDPDDFVIGEEVEASLPASPLRVHLNVWGIREEQHREIQRLRGDVADLTGWLRTSGVAYCFNHFVGALPVDLPSARTYLSVLSHFDALEVRNGMQGSRYNDLIASIAAGEAERRRPLAFIGGSDAHTLRRVGTTWTEAPASTREGFLEAIRRGRTDAGGRARRAADVILDPAALIGAHYRRLARTLGGGAEPGEGPSLPRVLATLPLQALGAPLVGTALYFLRVRAQVRALEREIAAMDLRSFRERMSAFPRTPGGGPPTGDLDAGGLPGLRIQPPRGP
jgi:predicted metal-dependent phosphoesterase TrpH